MVCITWCTGPQFIVADRYPKTSLAITSIMVVVVVAIVVMKEIYGVHHV